MLRWAIRLWCFSTVLILISKVFLRGSWFPYLIVETIGVLLFVGLILYCYMFAMKWYTTGAQMESATSTPMKAVGLCFEDFVIERLASVRIHGWYIPESLPKGNNPRHTAVVYSHGFGNSREVCGDATYRQIRALHENGHAVFTFDYPYGNRSDVHPMTAGVEESKDLLEVVEYARSKGYRFIIVFGYSFGGGTALAASLNGQIDALLLDSAFIARISVLIEMLERFAGLPRMLSRFLLPPFWRYYMGKNHPMETLINQPFNIPMFIAHGTSDSDTPYSVMEDFASRQTHPLSELLSVPGGEHMELHLVLGEEAYNTQVCDWLERVINHSHANHYNEY